MITTIDKFKNYLIKESIGDISLTEIDNKKNNSDFIKYLNGNFTKVESTNLNWKTVDVWQINGNLAKGYYIVNTSNNPYEIAYDLVFRYDNEEDEMVSDTLIEIKNLKDINKFKEIAASIITYNISEDAGFDAFAKIGKITKQITIELDLKHSAHSLDRQGRDSNYVKNSDIKETVDKATEQIIDLLIANKLNIGDPVWIFNTANDLNIVGALLGGRNTDVITFKLITCMFQKEFYNKNKTYKVTV